MNPILAGVRSPRQAASPSTWTTVDRDYESLRVNMQTLFVISASPLPTCLPRIDNNLSITLRKALDTLSEIKDRPGTRSPRIGDR